VSKTEVPQWAKEAWGRVIVDQSRVDLLAVVDRRPPSRRGGEEGATARLAERERATVLVKQLRNHAEAAGVRGSVGREADHAEARRVESDGVVDEQALGVARRRHSIELRAEGVASSLVPNGLEAIGSVGHVGLLLEGLVDCDVALDGDARL